MGIPVWARVDRYLKHPLISHHRSPKISRKIACSRTHSSHEHIESIFAHRGDRIVPETSLFVDISRRFIDGAIHDAHPTDARLALDPEANIEKIERGRLAQPLDDAVLGYNHVRLKRLERGRSSRQRSPASRSGALGAVCHRY